MLISEQIRGNIPSELNSFYKELGKANFKFITNEIIENIKENSKSLNYFFTLNNGLLKSNKYIKNMNSIKTNPRKYGISTKAEMYLLFMFSIDPNFEIAKIYGSYNTTKEIKFEIERNFGVYDSRLIKLERFFIKHFISEEDKNKINEEIERRAFK